MHTSSQDYLHDLRRVINREANNPLFMRSKSTLTNGIQGVRKDNQEVSFIKTGKFNLPHVGDHRGWARAERAREVKTPKVSLGTGTSMWLIEEPVVKSMRSKLQDFPFIPHTLPPLLRENSRYEVVRVKPEELESINEGSVGVTVPVTVNVDENQPTWEEMLAAMQTDADSVVDGVRKKQAPSKWSYVGTPSAGKQQKKRRDSTAKELCQSIGTKKVKGRYKPHKAVKVQCRRCGEVGPDYWHESHHTLCGGLAGGRRGLIDDRIDAIRDLRVI